MLDSDSRKRSLTVSSSAHEMSRHHASPAMLIASNYSSSPSSSSNHCTSDHVRPSRSDMSQKRSSPRLPRRLPIPPAYTPPSPTMSTFSSSTQFLSSLSSSSSSSSLVSLATPYHPSYPLWSVFTFLDSMHYLSHRSPLHSSIRPLPKPNLTPGIGQTPEHGAHIAKRSPPRPSSPADSMVSLVLPQRPTDVEEIRRGNLTKLRRHLGRSIPPDLIPPKLDRKGGSDSSSSDGDGEQDAEPASAPITPKHISKVTKGKGPILGERAIRRYSHRWLWEKKGRRWEEDDYGLILRRLRELR
jgi:hypothetical protein